MSKLKHKLIIEIDPRGTIEALRATGDMDIVIIQGKSVFKTELDSQFALGTGSEMYQGGVKKFLEKNGF